MGSNGLAFKTPTFLERPSYPDERRIQFADTVTTTIGRHTFKFCGDVNRVNDDTQNLRFEAGSFAYNNNVTDFILDYTNFLSPLPAGTTCATNTRLAGPCCNGNFHVFGVNTQIYSGGTALANRVIPLNFNQTNGVANFQQVTTTDSTLYRERQIQFSTRFQF